MVGVWLIYMGVCVGSVSRIAFSIYMVVVKQKRSMEWGKFITYFFLFFLEICIFLI